MKSRLRMLFRWTYTIRPHQHQMHDFERIVVVDARGEAPPQQTMDERSGSEKRRHRTGSHCMVHG